MIPVVSLFSGCGAMDLGFERHGFVPILAIDKDPASVDTYNYNRSSEIARIGDLSSLTGKDIIEMLKEHVPEVRPRGVIGGPPCQSFSISNVHGKYRDPRHKLPYQYAAILKTLNRKYNLDFFIFENVTGLKSNKHKKRYEGIRKSLEDAGFEIYEQILDASWFGVPQNRRRIFIVGINKEIYPDVSFKFPVGELLERVNVRQAIGDLPEPTFFTRGLLPDDIPRHPNHWTMNPKSKKFNQNGTTSTGRSFRKLKWETQSLTIAYGHREIYVHPNGHRRLSIFESMRLQGIPDDYVLRGNLSQQVTQVSDAIPPPLSAAIAQELQRAIYDPIEEIRNRLLDWFNTNQRNFPWRKTSDPYAIILAEKLLQQTSVNPTVVEIFNILLNRYPTIESLSQASVQDVSQLIAPLGFKYRARELINLAQKIVDQYSGRVPDKLDQLLELPGIGDYIARAVLCFAYGYPLSIVDTNVARFLYRIFDLKSPFPKNPARKPQLINLASNLVPEESAKNYNLAVLDFCYAICTSSLPKCKECFLLSICSYGKNQCMQSE